MNTTQAIQHLRKIGFRVSTLPNGKYEVLHSTWKKRSDAKTEDYSKTARELVKFAKIFSSENPQKTAIKRKVKSTEKGRLRTATNNLLHSNDLEKMDDVFSSSAKIVREDVWSWD